MKWDRPKPSRLCRYFSGIEMSSHKGSSLWYIENTDTWVSQPDAEALTMQFGLDWGYSSQFHCRNIRACRRYLRKWKRKGSIPLEKVGSIVLYNKFKGYAVHFKVGKI